MLYMKTYVGKVFQTDVVEKIETCFMFNSPPIQFVR